MPEGRVRVGVIGMGFGARTLVPALAASGAMELVAVCSTHVEHAQTVADAHGIPHAVDDFRQLIDLVDLVCVCTPPTAHFAMTMAAIDAGKHVLSAKPLAMDVAEAQELLDAARKSGVVHAMDLEMRYMPARRFIRDLVADGYLGELRFVSTTMIENHATAADQRNRFWSWVSERSQGGGILGTSLMNHHIDMVRWIFGEISAEHGFSTTLIRDKPVLPVILEGTPLSADTPNEGFKPVDTEDAVFIHGLVGSAPFSLAGTWSVFHPSGVRLEAYGSEGTLVLEGAGRILGARSQDATLKLLPLPEKYGQPTLGPDRIPLFIDLVNDLGGAILGSDSENLFATFEDGLRLKEIAASITAIDPMA